MSTPQCFRTAEDIAVDEYKELLWPRKVNTDMPISRSYPYLGIAKKYGIEYSTALVFGDFATRNNRDSNQSVWHLMENIPTRDQFVAYEYDQFLVDVNDAARYYRDIQSGRESFPPT